LRALSRRNWIILGILLALSLAWRSLGFSLGVLLGGLLVIYSFYLLRRQLQSLVAEPTRAMARKTVWYYLLRLFALAALFAAILASRRVDPFGLAAGVSVVGINLLWTMGNRILRKE